MPGPLAATLPGNTQLHDHVKPSKDGRSSTDAFLSAVYGFLYTLPSATLARLYESPSNCLAIFRLLPPFARLIISNMLWIPNSLVKKSSVYSWVRRGEGKRQLDASLVSLEKMHLLFQAEDNAEDDETYLALDENFQTHFRLALTGGGDHKTFGIACPNDGLENIDRAFLDEYAKTQWETILHFMVGSQVNKRPGSGVLYLLTESGLMVPEKNNAAELIITSKGFQFLLDDINSQIWHLLIRYLGMAESRKMDLVQILSFLFMLGGLDLGRPYSSEMLTPTQLTMLKDLTEYGLIYRPNKDDKRFFPTRLATTLTSSSSPVASAEESGTFVLIETNYRLYAYTSNPLQIAVLNLFVKLKARFSNLVVGMITRESVKSALANGIEADQIISYLTTHAHPQMRKQEPLLPPTVVDQIRLWEMEQNRTSHDDGYLYDDFKSDSDFTLVRDYAQQLGVLVWESEEAGKRQFVVTDQGHQIVREFIKRRMENSQ